jgi:hypothetical protein
LHQVLEGTRKVGFEVRLEEGGLDLKELGEATDTCVGNEDVESAELGDRLGDEVFTCRWLANVTCDKQK